MAALIMGLGTVALQLLLAGHGDAGADAGHDLAVDADAGAHDLAADADVHDLAADAAPGTELEASASHDALHAAGGGFLPIFLSLRFWVFWLMAFGMVGTILHYLQLAPLLVIPFVAAATGLASGLFATWSFRALARTATQSGSSSSDAIGHVGKVLVPCTRAERGKVRIELRGQTLDYLATTDDEALAAGELVLVEEMRDGTVHVSRAPAEFVLPGRER